MKEITSRQRDFALAIHSLTHKNGSAPTIRELRKHLGLASDQSVFEMLTRMEKAGLIIREKGRARGIVLTDAAKNELGLVAVASMGGSEMLPLELDDQRGRVFEKLSDIDPQLSKIYKGALFAFRNPGNDDRIAQSAHSMREVIEGLSDKAELPPEAKERLKKTRNTGRVVQGLLHFFDPQGVVGLNQNPYVYLYDEFQDKLNNIAHHRAKPSPEEYEAILNRLEYFLLRYIFPTQLEIYHVIDDILQKGSYGVDADDLKLLITRNVESYRYFFKHADVRWLSYLSGNGFMEAKWEVGEYLSRVAPRKPAEVLKIFDATRIGDDNWQSKTAFTVAASKLPAAFAAKTVPRIIRENWVKETRATLLHYRLQDLFKNLLSGKEYEAALMLADALLDIYPCEYGSYGSRDTHAYISEYEYFQLVKEILTLPSDAAYPFLKLLCEKLKKAIAEVHARGEEKDDDYSYIWRSSIENSPQNHTYDRIDDCLISGVRDLLSKHVEALEKAGQRGDAVRVVDEVLSHTPQFPLLTRLRLYVYRAFPATFKEQIEETIPSVHTRSTTWHEYSRLVNQEYPNLSTDAKNRYLDAIDKLDKADDEFIDSWRVRLITIIREYLTPSQKEKFAPLLKLGENLEQPYYTSYVRESSIVGPNSPKSEADFQGKTIPEVIELLKSWEPTDEFFGPSRSGLGMTFKDVVSKDATRYSMHAKLFLDEGLRPVFLYHYFSGLVEALKQKTEIDWDAILVLTTELLKKHSDGTLKDFTLSKEDRMESTWDNVLHDIARLMMRGFDTNGFTLGHKESAWNAVAYLAEHPDPTPEREEKYGGNNSDPFTMSINTVRGDALHAVFAYIFWYNRVEKKSAEKWVNSIPDEAKKLLERHLNPAIDPSLAVRSVYGRYFPWFLSYGKKWAKDLVPKVFPEDNIDLRYAAWETYLSHLLFQEAYRLLRPLYDLALDDLKEGRVPKRRYWSDTTERLAEHAMIAYVFEVEKGPDSFVKTFFKKANGKCRGIAVSMAGRHFVSGDSLPAGEKVPKLKILERFWEWRLEESDSPSELREFGWWVKQGKFDDAWMLEQLLKTVDKTKGDIDGEFLVMSALDALSEKHPHTCAKIFKRIFASSGRRDRYAFMHMGELRSAFTKILQTDDSAAKKVANDTIDYLLKLGFEEFRTLEDAPKSSEPAAHV